MGLKTIEACEVTCQKCGRTLIVKEWPMARDHGWAVPADGQLQLCPVCVAYQKGLLNATAIRPDLEPGQLPG